MNHIPPAPTTLTVTAKHQVTLRRAVLEHLGLAPGQKVVVDFLPDGGIALRAPPKGSVRDVLGMLRREGQKALSIEEMDKAVAAAVAADL